MFSTNEDESIDEHKPLIASHALSSTTLLQTKVCPLDDREIKADDTTTDTSIPSSKYSINTLNNNFYAVSLSFSVSTACATCCLAYAIPLLEHKLGGLSSGLFFTFYAISSFLLSKPMVTMLGPKNSLVCGIAGQTIYVFGFIISILLNIVSNHLSFVICCISSCIGGAASGLLWASQGVYLSRHVIMYANSTSQQLDNVTADFTAIFAVMLLSSEMIVKVLITLIFYFFGTLTIPVISSILSILVILCCIVIVKIKSLGISGTWDISYKHLSRDAGAAARLVWTDTRVTLLFPYQLAFGYSAGYVNYYIYGTIIKDHPSLGTGAVGVLSALVVFIGAIVTLPTAYSANRWGKNKVLIFCTFCIISVGWPVFFFTNIQLGSLPIMIFMLIFYGAGRGIWEVINKAVLIDFFASDGLDVIASSSSAMTFGNGYASGVGFFMFPYLNRNQMASLCVFGCIFSLITYLTSFQLQRRRNEIKKFNEEKEEKISKIREQARKSRILKEDINLNKAKIDEKFSVSIQDEQNINNYVVCSSTNIVNTNSGLATFGLGGFSLFNSSINDYKSNVDMFASPFANKIGGSKRKNKTVGNSDKISGIVMKGREEGLDDNDIL